jgi:tetratricopeptide (TPR) repeat protein
MKDLKAREKIVQELETKDTMGDIFKFGVSLLKEHRLDESIALFRTLTILKPEGFGGYFNLGVAYAKKGRYAESIEMFKRALQANPRHELTLQYIEKVKHLQSRHDETDPGPRQ